MDFTPDVPESQTKIDGSILEGGGQMVRLSGCLSAITGKPCKISNIRKNRPKGGGLSAQHKISLETLTLIKTDMVLKNCELSSMEVEIDHKNLMFFNSDTSHKIRHVDIGTAGSISLVIQTILPIMLDGENIIIQITGGTRVSFSPFIDYLYKVFLPSLNMEDLFKINIKRHGFYPAGGGCVQINRTIESWDNSPLTILERGSIEKVEMMVFAYGKMRNNCQQVIDLLTNKLKNIYGINIPSESINRQEFNAKGGSVGVMLILTTTEKRVLSVSNILGRNETFSAFTDQLAIDFAVKCVNSNACLDDNMADQALIIMALAEPGSCIRVNYPISLHTEAAIFVIEEFLPKRKFVIDVDDDDGELAEASTCRISCVLREIGKQQLLEYE